MKIFQKPNYQQSLFSSFWFNTKTNICRNFKMSSNVYIIISVPIFIKYFGSFCAISKAFKTFSFNRFSSVNVDKNSFVQSKTLKNLIDASYKLLLKEFKILKIKRQSFFHKHLKLKC